MPPREPHRRRVRANTGQLILYIMEDHMPMLEAVQDPMAGKNFLLYSLWQNPIYLYNPPLPGRHGASISNHIPHWLGPIFQLASLASGQSTPTATVTLKSPPSSDVPLLPLPAGCTKASLTEPYLDIKSFRQEAPHTTENVPCLIEFDVYNPMIKATSHCSAEYSLPNSHLPATECVPVNDHTGKQAIITTFAFDNSGSGRLDLNQTGTCDDSRRERLYIAQTWYCDGADDAQPAVQFNARGEVDLPPLQCLPRVSPEPDSDRGGSDWDHIPGLATLVGGQKCTVNRTTNDDDQFLVNGIVASRYELERPDGLQLPKPVRRSCTMTSLGLVPNEPPYLNWSSEGFSLSYHEQPDGCSGPGNWSNDGFNIWLSGLEGRLVFNHWGGTTETADLDSDFLFTSPVNLYEDMTELGHNVTGFAWYNLDTNSLTFNISWVCNERNRDTSIVFLGRGGRKMETLSCRKNGYNDPTLTYCERHFVWDDGVPTPPSPLLKVTWQTEG
ncbi:hypothetical protein B0H66DRAFT_630376 [Apodospora peruviana]|uniref:Uncharacterized protein n=1 Tax=Apodospora peruviana TaxID=516989 RepID=A0AAE0HW72_9PEZI|nr:hypothetical protein B0H66DRAFT_630376 [Apodospora peruviana]